MAKMVGLSRNIKLQWLNKTVELISESLTVDEIKEQLNEYLSFEITSPTNLRKTREILLNIWEYENQYTERIKPQALSLIRNYPEYSLAVHWCMMMAAYPVFADMCKLIGKISEFQDEITLAQIKQKLFDEWGERTTLYHSIDKLVSTLKDFGALICDKPGKYHIGKQKLNNSKIVDFMLYVTMLVDNSGYYTLNELRSMKYLFPFEYNIAKEQLLDDSKFVLNNFGGELSIAITG